jgi:hypothetical protein
MCIAEIELTIFGIVDPVGMQIKGIVYDYLKRQVWECLQATRYSSQTATGTVY